MADHANFSSAASRKHPSIRNRPIGRSNSVRSNGHVNELPIVAHIRATRPIGPNEEVTENDIGDMQSVDFGVELPVDAVILVIMSAKWRKGLFFDFGPLSRQGDRAYDINELLSSYFVYLHNQAIFSLSEDDWIYLIEQLWFPFVGLPKKRLRTLQ